MSSQFRSYDVARSTFGFLEFLGWAVVALGILAGLGLSISAGSFVGGGQKFMLFISGASFSLVGLFLVGSVQNWRAGVDTAEYNQQLLKIARDQLQVSKQSVGQPASRVEELKLALGTQNQTVSAASEPLAAPKPEPAPSKTADDLDRVIEFEGRQILIENGKYNVNGIPFGTRRQAENYIRNFAREGGQQPMPAVLEPPKEPRRPPAMHRFSRK